MTAYDISSFGALLASLRKRRSLTQQALAEALGIHRSTLVRWEQGDYLPQSKAMVLELARHLKLAEQETRQLLEASLTALPPHWLVPLPRNPFFTGREEILEDLRPHLRSDQAAGPARLALHGLGGVGKTQIALEYAYRFALEYRAIFWMGAETEAQLYSGLLQIAGVLSLSGPDERDQQAVVAAVQQWLSTHGQWLLIVDNVDDLSLLDRLLPLARSGAMLLTTRCQTLGTRARGVELLPMQQEEGLLLLLRRAKVLSPDADSGQLRQFAAEHPTSYSAATALVRALGGLPLALDQAGAYLEATHCSLPAYLDLFDSRRRLLLRSRGEGARDHPQSVWATFTLALSSVARRHPAVGDLLRVCALLQPDAIPEELFLQGAEMLGPRLADVCRDPVEWDRVLSAACSTSLLSRQAEARTLSLHRLVQAVLLDSMTQTEQEHWRRRVIEALDTVFPDVRQTRDPALWKQGERLLSHVLLCLFQPGAEGDPLPRASLAAKAAEYLQKRGRYAEAEPLCRRALCLQEGTLGLDHPEVAHALNRLAILCWKQGKYAEAETRYRRALRLWEQASGPEHPDVARVLNNLAILAVEQGRYLEAEPLYLRALHLQERTLGPDHALVGTALNNLAELYTRQGRYTEAEPLYLRAVQIARQALGSEHPAVAHPLNGLATVYTAQGKQQQAELLYQRALCLREQHLGPQHPETAQTLHDLAACLLGQGRDGQAEALYRQAKDIWERTLGASHPAVATALRGLATLAERAGNAEQAESWWHQAYTILEGKVGSAHPETVKTRLNYERLHGPIGAGQGPQLEQVQERTPGAEPTVEQVRALLKARGWSLHLKKRRSKLYAYATRQVSKRTQSRYLAPLSNLVSCVDAARRLPNAKEL